jgi:hypothetical protein
LGSAGQFGIEQRMNRFVYRRGAKRGRACPDHAAGVIFELKRGGIGARFIAFVA